MVLGCGNDAESLLVDTIPKYCNSLAQGKMKMNKKCRECKGPLGEKHFILERQYGAKRKSLFCSKKCVNKFVERNKGS